MTAVRWLTADRADVPDSLGWLAADERARLDRLTIAKRRGDYLLGRWAGKRVIAAQLSPVPALASIAIRAADDGAPQAFLDGAPMTLVLSLSHSAGRALAAVCDAGAALGADLERVEPRSQLLVDDFFTADEAAEVAARPPGLRDHAITLVWSAKESALKALRCGLRDDPRRMRVALVAAPALAGWSPLQVAFGDPRRVFDGWWRDDAGHVLTIVGDGLTAPPSPSPG